MSAVNPTDLAFLRDRQPPRVEWFVAVAPWGNPVFEARINDATISRGAMEIHFDGGMGVPGLVEPGMTLWVGSTGSSNDLGSMRIRSITGSTSGVFGVSENDEILWADDLFLTVPGESGFREPWSVFPRMVEAGGSVIFYKDYDRAYNNEGNHLPPKANAGPPAIAFIDPTSGLATLQWVGEDSYATETAGAPLVAWAWQFPGGTPSTSALEGTLAVPVQVTWNTPGFHYVKLTVEDTLGTTGTTHIPVWIFDESGPQVPLRRVEVLDQAGSAQNGWSARLKVFDVGLSDFPDRSLVVLGIRTWYRGTRREIGGYPYRENIRFVGWVDRETLTYDATVGTVEFEAQGLSEVMGQMPAFSLYLEENGSPGEWYEMVDNNADRMSHHILEFHSTINQIAHVNRPGEGNTRKIESAGFPDTNLLAQLGDNLWADIMCEIVSDRQGLLQITRDPQMMVVGDRAAVVTTCALTKSDWMELVNVPKAHRPELGFVELGGFGYDTPYLSQAPGAAPLQQEQATRINECILDTADPQTNANWWSGLALTKKNTAYPELPVTLKGFWPIFDPAFQEWVELNFEDPYGRRPFENARFLVREVSFRDDPETITTTTQLTLESESELLIGETVDIPPAPPPEPPDPPIYPPTPPPGEPWEGPIKACIAWTQSQLGYTPDILLHHHAGTATAGTGGVDLYDTAADFVTLGVAVGDAVEEMGTPPVGANITTVASVVNPTHLTLTADIGLAATSEYHICGAQWTNIEGSISGDIYQFLYVRTGVSTVGGWVLTSTGVYYAANVLTPSPSWSLKLTLAQVRIDTGDIKAYFKGIHGYIAEPGYVIVVIRHDNNWGGPGYGPYTGGYVHTHDYGAGWTYAAMPAGCRVAPFYGIEIAEPSGKIWNIRGGPPGGTSYIYWSSDGGGSFTRSIIQNLGETHIDTRLDLYNPYAAGDGDLYITKRQCTVAPGKSSDSGITFALMTEVGYQTAEGKSGINGWYGDASLLFGIWQATDDTHYVLLKSVDAGGSWVEIGDANVLFGGLIGMWAGSIIIVPETWLPDADVLLWSGLQGAPLGMADHACRIRYTHDCGAHWYNEMGNWLTVFGTWAGAAETSGNSGGVGCIPLPRVGANA